LLAQIRPGAKVLYLGAASGSSVSHVSDIVGPEGVVYAVEFSHRSGRDLIGMAKKRTNVIRKSTFIFVFRTTSKSEEVVAMRGGGKGAEEEKGVYGEGELGRG